MNTKDVIRSTLNMSMMVLKAYVSDLSDAELLTRPGVGCNHVAWQLGHLIHSANHLLEAVAPGKSLVLPDGFESMHSKETGSSNDPAKFLCKQNYLDLYDHVNAAALSALDAAPDTFFDQPAPDSYKDYAPTMGDVYILIATHPMMHAGQFVPVRRLLGKPVII